MDEHSDDPRQREVGGIRYLRGQGRAMQQKQTKSTTVVETKRTERKEPSQPKERRLHLDTLESRVAPSALWGD
jgi:hypothetical protein